MFRNLVVPLKQGLPSGPLVSLAQGVAASGARVHLVTLVMFDTPDPELERIREAETWLKGLAATLRGDLEVTVEAGVGAIAVAPTIATIAESRNAELVVIGLGKRTRVGKALVGSDAQRILLSVPCPVLVTRLD